MPRPDLGTASGLAIPVKVSGWAARAAYGGNAARAASAWEHRVGVTTRLTRQTPAGGQARARLGNSREEVGTRAGHAKASGWFDNRTQR